jgi:hypothetical protein
MPSQTAADPLALTLVAISALAGVIVFLFLRSEKRHDKLLEKLDAEHQARLQDQQRNQVALLEVHDRTHEGLAILEQACERADKERERAERARTEYEREKDRLSRR